ncbi:CPBP family intramembrane glutamic endopeptidase [Bacillus sp. AK031]
MEKIVQNPSDLLSKNVTAGFLSSSFLCISVIFVFIVSGMMGIDSYLSFSSPVKMFVYIVCASVALVSYGAALAYIVPSHLIDDTNKSFAEYPNHTILAFMFLIVLFEELLFRGIIQNAAFLMLQNEWLSIGIGALAFLLFHVRYFKKPVMLFNIILPSVVFGWGYSVTDNILVPIAVHFFMNVTMTLIFKYNLVRLK